MAKVRIPLIGNPTNRNASISYDQRFVNCFPEVIKDTVTGESRTYVMKRDGMDFNSQPSGTTGEGRGLYSWNSKLYSVIGNKLYSGTTAIKTLTTNTSAVNFTEFSSANDFLVMLDGVKGYYISTTDVVTEITDVDFPTPHLPYPVFMDGYLFVQKTTGEIFNSDSGLLSDWSATSFISPESYPDGAVAICRQNNLLTALGAFSVEFFYDAANPAPGSPLGRNLQAVIQYGCASGTTVAQEEGLVLFVGQSLTGEKFVVQIEGTKDTHISTEAINRVLQAEGSNIVDSWGYLTRMKGHLLYVLNLSSQGRTLVYDINTQLWHEWEWFDGTSDSIFPMIDSTEYQDQSWFLHQANGKIYEGSQTIYKDDYSIKCLIQTPRYLGESGNVKFMSRLEVIADWQATPSEMSIYWSDDDYKTWSAARTVDLQDRAYIYRCGSFRRRAFRLYHAADTALRLATIECEIDEGFH